MPDYRYADISNVMARFGLARGDIVVMHSDLAKFGVPAGTLDRQAICRGIVDAARDVIGPEGTLVVPTFSYSFGRDKAEKVFDLDITPSVCGVLTEYVRKEPSACRSREPMLSVAALGVKAKAVTENVSNLCLGAGSVWERLLSLDAKICNLNLNPGSTFIHYIERLMNVPYRSDIRMDGMLIENGNRVPYHVIYPGRDLNDPRTASSRARYFERAYAEGIARKQKVGRGFVSVASFADTAALATRLLRADPWAFTAAANAGPVGSLA
jgi:aminoglycoside 3-N-acetyltransferase